MGKIRITLDSVHCSDTEDVSGADTFYIVGAVITDDPDLRKGILTTPFDINDGQTKGFRPEDAILFEGDLPDDQSVGLMLQAFDEDADHDWAQRPKWIDETTKGVGVAAGGAVVAGLSTNPVGWGVIAAGVATGLTVGGFYLLVGSDKDDQLGSANIVIPVKGYADELQSWSFSHHHGGYLPWELVEDWYSDWSYTVSYRIHRVGTNVVPYPEHKEQAVGHGQNAP